MLAEDEVTLPPTASHYVQVAPAESTVFRGIGLIAGMPAGSAMAAALTVVPVTITASEHVVAAGQAVQLNFSGPNNGSSYFLTVLPENTTIPLNPDSCSGVLCRGAYLTGPLGANKLFMVGATGPYQGQAYSQPLTMAVTGGMALSCTASPAAPAPGQAVTISWMATNATSVRIDQGVGESLPQALGSVIVRPTQSTTYTCTATDRFGGQISTRTKAIVSSGDVSNLNHIVFMLQENRAFDNYFGSLAY